MDDFSQYRQRFKWETVENFDLLNIDGNIRHQVIVGTLYIDVNWRDLKLR
jgi:hypothetical protein